MDSVITPYLRGRIDSVRERLKANRERGEIVWRWHDDEVQELLDVIERLEAKATIIGRKP